MSSTTLKATLKHDSLWQSEDAPVPWWSFAKTSLAAAALRLVSQDKLELDKPVADEPYTLRHLLQHRAGLGDYSSIKTYHEAVARNDEPWSTEEMLERSKTQQRLYSPGEGWGYSNIGYYLVRREIEETIGTELGAALEELVFTPLGVEGVRLARTGNDLADTHWCQTGYHPGWVFHGLLMGTPAQAVQLLHGLMRSDLLPRALLKEMTTPYLLDVDITGRPGKKPGYGLGLMVGESERGVMYGHTGQGPGSTCAVYHFAEQNPVATVAVFQQSMDQGAVEFQAVVLAG